MRDPEYMRTWNRERARSRTRFLTAVKLTAGCVDCGYDAASEALDFDHNGSKKRGDGKAMKTNSLAWAIEELMKCDIVCANCHRIRSRKERWGNNVIT